MRELAKLQAISTLSESFVYLPSIVVVLHRTPCLRPQPCVRHDLTVTEALPIFLILAGAPDAAQGSVTRPEIIGIT